MSEVPAARLRTLNDRPLNPDGNYVLYWMTAFRRPFYNFALQRAVARATALGKPLLILETLRCDAPYANDRLHKFALQGMADNAAHFAQTRACYYPFIETAQHSGEGLLENLSASACLAIADDHPGCCYPQRLDAAAQNLSARLEAVDSNGLMPIRNTDQVFATAYAFRRFLQKELPRHLFDVPLHDPLRDVILPPLESIPAPIAQKWPVCTEQLTSPAQTLANLPIDHAIAPVAERGGWRQAENDLQRFISERLPHYLLRSEPDRQVSSALSPYLRFGHISAHQIVAQLLDHENWTIDRLSLETRGKKSGWWGLSAPAEGFLDELITWREVGFNAACHLPGYDRYDTLPTWARATLADHRDDLRPYRYEMDQFVQAQTHDPLWNAAQTQLIREGRIQNYLRMLWGKKILEWSPDAQTALQTMLALNDSYALDGRDSNSISGIFWCLGRYDRAWGPERPIFGKIRYMSSENTARKFNVKNYLKQYTP